MHSPILFFHRGCGTITGFPVLVSKYYHLWLIEVFQVLRSHPHGLEQSLPFPHILLWSHKGHIGQEDLAFSVTTATLHTKDPSDTRRGLALLYSPSIFKWSIYHKARIKYTVLCWASGLRVHVCSTENHCNISSFVQLDRWVYWALEDPGKKRDHSAQHSRPVDRRASLQQVTAVLFWGRAQMPLGRREP